MIQYIDKSAVVAEIKKRIKETESMQPKFDQFWAGQISAFKGVLKILDSLKVKVVEEPTSNDLEKEINLEDIKEQIIERTAEILAERLLKEIKENKGNIPYDPAVPINPMDMQPVMYGCPVRFPSVLDNPIKYETISGGSATTNNKED